MRGVFGLVGLVVVLAIVGLLAKKQLAAVRAPLPAVPGAVVSGAGASSPAPAGDVRAQSQQIQQQYKQQLESAMQQVRPQPDDAEK